MNLEEEYKDEAMLIGKIVERPICRETSFGRKINEVKIEINENEEKICVNLIDEGRYTNILSNLKAETEIKVWVNILPIEEIKRDIASIPKHKVIIKNIEIINEGKTRKNE